MILTGLTKSTDHPSRGSFGPVRDSRGLTALAPLARLVWKIGTKLVCETGWKPSKLAHCSLGGTSVCSHVV